MDRLLTQKEQNTLANAIDETQFETSVQSWEAILGVITKAQDAKTAKLVRQEIGELLYGKPHLCNNMPSGKKTEIVNLSECFICILINALKRGEMPNGT